jgi:hypothetical protein
MYHGAPFRLFGVPMYRRIDMAHITEKALVEPSEKLLLWQRLSVFDARALLGYFCYREGDYEDAHRIWDRMPDPNIEVRPDIKELIAEVTHAIAIQKGVSLSHPRLADGGQPDNPSASAWRAPAPAVGLTPAPRLQPLDPGAPQAQPPQNGAETMFWQPNRWAEANGFNPTATPYRDPGQTYPPVVGNPAAPAPQPAPADDNLSEMAETPFNGAQPDPDAMVVNTSSPGVQRPSETGDL